MGFLKEVSVYDRALSDAEIANLANGVDGRYEYHHVNALGSNIVLTDDDKNVLVRYEYDVFGAIRSEVGTSDNPRKFTGKEYESDVKLYYYGARYYDPYIGRFVSRDPVGDGVNWYAYTNNNPLKYIDPNGKEPVQSQTGTVAAMFDELNDLNPDAGEGNLLDFFPGVPGVDSDSVRTPGQIPEHNRYVYTENYGWIDMRHFFASAATAYAYLIGEAGSGHPVSRMKAAVFANLMGYHMELYQWATGNRSAFSYEDLPSNAAGAVFGAFIYNPGSELTLFEQARDWINNQAPLDPIDVTNFHLLPKEKERDTPPLKTSNQSQSISES